MPISQYNSPCLDTLTPHSIHLPISIQPKNNMVPIPTLNQPMVQKPNKMNQQLLPYLLTSKESPRYNVSQEDSFIVSVMFTAPCLLHSASLPQSKPLEPPTPWKNHPIPQLCHHSFSSLFNLFLIKLTMDCLCLSVQLLASGY